MKSLTRVMAAFFASLCCVAVVHAEQIQLASRGSSEYVVVLPLNPTPQEKFAADEFVSCVNGTTGIQLPITRGETSATHAISFDAAETTDPVNGGQTPDSFGFEASNGHVKVFGNRGRALLFATYALLEELGCPWLAPDLKIYENGGRYVPKLRESRVQLRVDNVTSTPLLKLRKLYVEEGHSHTTDSLVEMVKWMPKVGYNTLVIPADYQGSGRVKWDNWRTIVAPEMQKRDLIIEVGGHGYQNFLNAKMENGRLFQEHPEWFGTDDRGKRREAKNFVFCTSNRAAVDYVTNGVVTYLKERPEINIFDFWPPDGAKWCECPDCLKMGSPAERQVMLANGVSAAVKRIRPDVRFEILAYSSYLEPPANTILNADILLDFCPINQRFDVNINDPASPENASYVKALKAWRAVFPGDISIYSYYRKYAWDSLPLQIPHYMQRDLGFYRTIPVQGVSSYAEPGDWYTYELNHYALGKLAAHEVSSVEPIITDLLKARYGNSDDVARQCLDSLARNVRTKGSVPFSPVKSPEEIAKGESALRQCLQKLKTEATKPENSALKGNFERLGLMLTYAAEDLNLRGMQARGETTDTIEPSARALHEFLNANGDKGVFLVSNKRLSLQRVLGHYGIKRQVLATEP